MACVFSKRKLTYQRDKLPAPAGVTARMEKILNDTSVVGLWRSSFHSGLLWSNLFHRKGIQNRTSVDLWIPTWSWLSIDGPIEYFQAGITPEKGRKTITIMGNLKRQKHTGPALHTHHHSLVPHLKFAPIFANVPCGSIPGSSAKRALHL
jgi:hypothetical protein